MKSKKSIIDISLAAGLAVAVLLVIGFDKLLPEPDSGLIENNLNNGLTPKARKLRLAVSPTYIDTNGSWDDMPSLLRKLGENGKGYEHDILAENEQQNDFENKSLLLKYDVIFLTCANKRSSKKVVDNLREFVEQGGTLYASDWRYKEIAFAFPEYVTEGSKYAGRKNPRLVAKVIDPGLQDLLGSTIRLNFNMNEWRPALFKKSEVEVLMTAKHAIKKNFFTQQVTSPLLVKFRHGKGTVIFTSFHNESQNDEMEIKLLKYLVFSAVTAKMGNKINEEMISGGFSPKKTNLFGVSKGSKSFTRTYQNKTQGKLRFVLGFKNEGAKLKLTVVSPDGQEIEKEGASTFQIDIPNAQPGGWRYTVTALRVPYDDFPFNLTIGTAKQ